MTTMKALSIRQPWADLIVSGEPVCIGSALKGYAIKDVENRSRRTHYRGKVLVHASKRWEADAAQELRGKGVCIGAIKDYPAGAIIGSVYIVDCVTESNSPWFTGPFGWVLKNPVVFPQPVPMKGRLGLFNVEWPPPPVTGDTTVVNIGNGALCDVRIDRGSKWGNPFKMASTTPMARAKVVSQYAEWIQTQPELLADLHELKGKRLGCWCAPLMCHGNVLVELVEAL